MAFGQMYAIARELGQGEGEADNSAWIYLFIKTISFYYWLMFLLKEPLNKSTRIGISIVLATIGSAISQIAFFLLLEIPMDKWSPYFETELLGGALRGFMAAIGYIAIKYGWQWFHSIRKIPFPTKKAD